MNRWQRATLIPLRGCFAIAALTLSASAWAVDVSWLAVGRADVRLRTPLPGDVGKPLTADLELLPAGRLSLGWSRTLIEFSYTPSLLFREPHLQGPVRLMNRGSAAVRTRWRRATFALQQQGSYGQADVGALRTREDSLGSAPVVEVQTLGLVPFVSSATTATLDLSTSERGRLSVTGGYLLSGSPDNPVLPMQRGPLVRASFRFAFDRRDTLTTTTQATHADFVNGQQQTYAFLTEEWSRQPTRLLNLSVMGGVAFTHEVVPEGLPSQLVAGTYDEVLPVAATTLAWRDAVSTPTLQLETGLRLAPFADRFTGLIYERVEARLTGRKVLSHLWLSSNLGAAWAVPLGRSPQAGDVIVFADAAAGWPIKQWLTLVGSTRVLYAHQPRLGVDAGGVQWVLTLSVMVQHQGSTSW